MQKKLTPHCRQCPSMDDHLASCSSLTTSICREAANKNCNNSLKEWRKHLLHTAWKSALSKANATCQHTDEWKSGEEMDQILGIHTNQRWSNNKGSKDQTGTSILFYDKASNAMGKQSHQFTHKGLQNTPTADMKTIKGMNMYGNRPISSPDVRSFYCQPSSVASFQSQQS